ncbi:MAG: peptidoglycan editing factor PgeF [Armatimonadota bacterium]|nr:peptidoglycan editing factor PgeF [Armatimonadota bacterium]
MSTGPAAPLGVPVVPSDWRWAVRDGVLVLLAALLDDAGVPHAFTTRVGGVSAPPFDTLNLGRAVGDAREAVVENRRRALGALDRPLADHVEASQVHGAAAAVVGAADRGAKIPSVDILATRDPSVVLAMHCADCVPVLLADPARRAVAAVHTGWRGTAVGAAAAAVRAMVEAFACRPRDLLAAIGPAIGPCCYEVDTPVREGFARWPWREAVFAPRGPDRWVLDLWEANRRQVIEAGVRPEAVTTSALCTSCLAEVFFSHRRDGRTGRMAGMIAVPKR